MTCARCLASTAFAAVILLLLAAPAAAAAPPTCQTPQPPQTVQTGDQLFLFPSCSDPDGDLLGFAITTPPAHGDATVEADAIRYMPEAPYTGPDQLAFTASDGTTTTDPVT